ncbi:DUF1643 domain-containing protein [Priestia megaterium]|nr:DUF1643 domain-containing protein [Priestia megaterium]
MVKQIEETIKSTAVLSDNNQYRYKLSRVWNEEKPNAAVLMLNPSKADMLKTDKTVMNVNNYLVDKGYGSFTIVNLFAFRTTEPKFLNQRDEIYETLNDDYLAEAFYEADVIIVAWVRDKDKYVRRKRAVEKLLLNYKEKVKCFEDSNGKKLRHPRDLTVNWKLIDYEFMFIEN